MELAPDFDEFIGCLTAHGVEFLVVGAYALAFHGAPRFTGDLGVWCNPTLENSQRVLTALAAFGFPVPELTAADLVNPRRMVQMGVEPVQIHLMGAISGVTWDEAQEDRIEGRCGRQNVWYLGRQSFLKNKRAAGRHKDLADIEALAGRDDV